MIRMSCLLLLAMVATACQPVTLGHEGRIDFTKYRSVYVQPIVLTGDAVFDDIDTGTQGYLIREIRDIGGFTTVTNTDGNPTDTVLAVSMRVTSDEDFETGNVRYTADAEFRLRTLGGTEISFGSSSSSNGDLVEAQEDALDDIALHFLRPYRI